MFKKGNQFWKLRNLDKLKEKTKEAMWKPEVRERYLKGIKKRKTCEEWLNSKRFAGKKHTGKTKLLMSINNCNNRQEIKALKKELAKKQWKNSEIKEKMIEGVLKSRFKRPTKLEQKFIELFKKYNLPFNYCGDGSLIIGFKNPDFVESDGEKICLEVGNKSEKNIFSKQKSWKIYERDRIKHFAKYGWKCIVLWEDELKRIKEAIDHRINRN